MRELPHRPFRSAELVRLPGPQAERVIGPPAPELPAESPDRRSVPITAPVRHEASPSEVHLGAASLQIDDGSMPRHIEADPRPISPGPASHNNPPAEFVPSGGQAEEPAPPQHEIPRQAAVEIPEDPETSGVSAAGPGGPPPIPPIEQDGALSGAEPDEPEGTHETTETPEPRIVVRDREPAEPSLDNPAREAEGRIHTVGTPAEKGAFRAEARALAHIPSLVVVGSVARAAMYADAQWDQTSPIALQSRSISYPYDLSPRDIDVVSPFGVIDKRLIEALGPHAVDTAFNVLFNHAEGYQVGIDERITPVSPEVYTVMERVLDGAPLRTFTYGTQYFIDRLLMNPGTPTKYIQVRAEFQEFVRHVMRTKPEEFLPNEMYEPFRRFNPEVGDLPPPAPLQVQGGWEPPKRRPQ